jgi:hypothetical protein
MVVVQGGFDAGARFGPGQSASIPVSFEVYIVETLFVDLWLICCIANLKYV